MFATRLAKDLGAQVTGTIESCRNHFSSHVLPILVPGTNNTRPVLRAAALCAPEKVANAQSRSSSSTDDG